MTRAIAVAVREVQTLLSVGSVGGLDDAQLLDRFLAGQVEAAEIAFRVLVERHGPMVLRVCGEILGDPHAAQDAAQATFLVLAHKAHRIGRRDLLGNWLYGVAHRTALKARATAARQRRHELRAAGMTREAVHEDPDRHDIVPLIHEEINRLPRQHRAPVVLCDLEGLSYARAAAHIGVTEDALRGRLARARSILRERLVRRGVVLSAGACALSLPSGAKAAIPSELVVATVRAVIGITRSGVAPAGAVSASVASLAGEVLGNMTMSKLKMIACCVCSGMVLAAGATVFAQQGFDLEQGAQGAAKTDISATPLLAATQADPKAHPGQVGRNGIDESLARSVESRIVGSLPITKDGMVLSYMPDWAHGDVDNIGVADNDGGVRTLLEWPAIPPQEARSVDRRYVLALHARRTTAGPMPGPILAFPITQEWPERVSWRTQPDYDPEPAGTYQFSQSEGWKLFDVTAIVRAEAEEGHSRHGILLRFLSEDRSGQKKNWSGYEFVSREGSGRWETHRPILLVLERPGK